MYSEERCREIRGRLAPRLLEARGYSRAAALTSLYIVMVNRIWRSDVTAMSRRCRAALGARRDVMGDVARCCEMKTTNASH